MLSGFLRDVLPSTGVLGLWTKSDKHNHWYDSQDALAEAIQQHVDTQAQGVYFATAAFNKQAAINGDKDARTQANVTGKKCFYLDLDAGAKKFAKHGGEKVYRTQQDAIAATVRFVKDTSLNPTYLISSGEGLHVYWVLDDAIEGDLWTFAAKRLAKLFKQYGLKADPAVTADSARVLRPLGTLHENGTSVKPLTRRGQTYSYDGFQHRLTNLLVESDADELAPPPKYTDKRTGINADVLVEGPPKSFRKILPQCAALANVVRTRGCVEEPYWRAAIGVVKHCVDGDRTAHYISSGYAGYDRGETQRKLDNWKTGPTTCSEFSKHCIDCKSCPQWGKIKSPITLGYMNDVEVQKLPEDKKLAALAPAIVPTSGNPWDGFLPEGFTVKKEGAQFTLYYRMPVQRQDDDGVATTTYITVPLTHDIFWLDQWSDAEHSGDHGRYSLCKVEKGIVRKYDIGSGDTANPRVLSDWLALKTVTPIPSTKGVSQHLWTYIIMQIQSLKLLDEMPKIKGRFGMFITEGGDLFCAQGRYVIKHTGEIYKSILSDNLVGVADKFTIPLPGISGVKWDADVWESHIIPKARRHAEFLKKHWGRPGMEKFQLAIMMQLASPLMPFTNGEYTVGHSLPPSGLTVTLFSQEGGRGKTAAMRAAALAYGSPQATVSDRNTVGSTALGRIARMSMMGTMSVGMDEMGDTPVYETANLVSAVANGGGRERADKYGGLVVGVPWSLICIMATNKSQRDMIAAAQQESNAIQYRLLELDVDNQPEFSGAEQKEFREEWAEIVSECAGALGALIHKLICELGVSAVNKLVSKTTSKASDLIESRQADRFQHRGLGAVIALQSLLNSAGIEMFDLRTLVATTKAASQLGHTYAVENTLPTDGLSLLNMALHSLMPFTVVTETETRRTRFVTKYDEPVVALPHLIHARHVISTKRTYASTAALRDWCAEKKVSFVKVIHAAREAGVLLDIYSCHTGSNSKAMPFNLLKGMRGSADSLVSCYAFDINRLKLCTGRALSEPMISDDAVQDVVLAENSNVVPLTAKAPDAPAVAEPVSASQ